jgi:hypothetical protein
LNTRQHFPALQYIFLENFADGEFAGEAEWACQEATLLCSTLPRNQNPHILKSSLWLYAPELDRVAFSTLEAIQRHSIRLVKEVECAGCTIENAVNESTLWNISEIINLFSRKE